jgi:hypothetical protein
MPHLTSVSRRSALILSVVVLATTAGSAPATDPGLPILAKAAEAVGVRSCLAAVATVSSRATVGATAQDVILDWDHGQPDAKAFFSLTGLEFGPRSAALSLTVVPEAGGGCSIMAERISGAPIACAVVAKSELTGYVGHPLLSTVEVYVNPHTPRETVTLVSTPPGCLIIRRQADYNWRAAQ